MVIILSIIPLVEIIKSTDAAVLVHLQPPAQFWVVGTLIPVWFWCPAALEGGWPAGVTRSQQKRTVGPLLPCLLVS